MTEKITITTASLVATVEGPELSAEDRRALQQELARRLDREMEKAILGGWPPGYEPGKGFSGTLDLSPRRRCRCAVICMCGAMVVT